MIQRLLACCLALGSICLAEQNPGGEGGYGPGSDPQVGDIQHLCVAQYPAPRDRTDIGIGEQVTCWIDAGTWYDQDVQYTGGGGSQPVSDSMGQVTWSVSGGGTVNPTTGTSVTVTASLSPGQLTVTAMIADSGAMGMDPAVQKQAQLNKKAPTGLWFWYDADLANEFAPAGPPNNKVGSGTRFGFQVQPNNVNFAGVLFRENIPKQDWTWPDGNKEIFQAKVINWMVADGPPPGNQPNFGTERSKTGKSPAFVLNGQDFAYAINVPEEYMDDNQQWTAFGGGEKHDHWYRGATLDGCTGVTGQNSAAGSWMGPWQ